MEAVVLSPGMRRIPHLAAFLPEYSALRRSVSRCCEAVPPVVLGWGNKPTSRRAQAIAARRGLAYVALEDGFLRSFGLGVEGAPPLSLVVDPQGIYYDASRPSRLESLLANNGWETPALLDRAASAIAAIRAFRLSKYNAAPEADLAHLAARAGGRTVLVVDQTAGDASIAGGGGDAATFAAMLASAESAVGDGGRIIVKTHPDVIAGRKRGYLTELAAARGHLVFADAVNPWSLFDVVDGVYTVTSQLGFEALLAGLPVHCFGLPFYAGWGVTTDASACARRTRRRDLREIFAGAYIAYARYVDPFTGKPGCLEATIDLLSDLKRHAARNQGPAVCLGFSRWKRGFVRRFLSGPGGPRVSFRRSPDAALAKAARDHARLVVWASSEPDDLAEAARRQGVAIQRMEDGFLRSVGLGCTLVRPQSLVLDDTGIYFDPNRESGLERLLLDDAVPAPLIARAARLRALITRLGISKYNLGTRRIPLPLPEDGRRRILVPGQVEDDASVRLSADAIRRNRDLLRAVRAAAPDAFLIYKPHPDVEAGLRRGHVGEADARRWCDAVAGNASILDLIAAVDEVHTISSLTGFEALLRGKAVTTYGAPFYAGWGLTTDRVRIPRRTRTLCLDELVAAALILYPLYVDPVSGHPCPVETVIERLATASTKAPPWLSRATVVRSLARLFKPIPRPVPAR